MDTAGDIREDKKKKLSALDALFAEFEKELKELAAEHTAKTSDENYHE